MVLAVAIGGLGAAFLAGMFLNWHVGTVSVGVVAIGLLAVAAFWPQDRVRLRDDAPKFDRRTHPFV